MTITKEVRSWELKNELWSGGLHTFDKIAENCKVPDLIELLEELYPDGAGITTINDLLWFEADYIYEQLNIETDD